MSSFGEKKAIQLAKDQGKDFIGYTKRQLARIYPGGTRIDSSNYDPVPLWNAGCQLGKINKDGWTIRPDRGTDRVGGVWLGTGETPVLSM